jgi:hypothetical protein
MTPRQSARLLARSGARDARARLARQPPHRPRRFAHRGLKGVARSIPRDAGRERSAARGVLAGSDGPGGPRVFLHGMLSVQPAANTSWRFGQQAPLSPVQQLSDRRPCFRQPARTCRRLCRGNRWNSPHLPVLVERASGVANQPLLPVGASASRARQAGCADRHSAGGGARLRGDQVGLDSPPTGSPLGES